MTGVVDRSAQRTVSRAESFPHKGETRSCRVHTMQSQGQPKLSARIGGDAKCLLVGLYLRGCLELAELASQSRHMLVADDCRDIDRLGAVHGVESAR